MRDADIALNKYYIRLYNGPSTRLTAVVRIFANILFPTVLPEASKTKRQDDRGYTMIRLMDHGEAGVLSEGDLKYVDFRGLADQ